MRRFRSSAAVTLFTFVIIGIRNLLLSAHLDPADYSLNALSTQLLVVYGLLDFGYFQFLKAELPATENLPTLRGHLLYRAQWARSQAVLIATGISLISVLLLLRYDSHGSPLPWIAAALVFTAQSGFALRTARYIASNQQRRAVQAGFWIALVNISVTGLLIDRIGVLVIAVSPFIAYWLILIVDSRRSGGAHWHQERRRPDGSPNVSQWTQPRRNLWVTQILSATMSYADIALGLVILSAYNSGLLSFATNVVSVVPLLPLLVSGRLVPVLSHPRSDENRPELIRLLMASQRLSAVSNSVVAAGATFVLTLLTYYWLPAYASCIPVMWILILAALIYTNCFYSSTLPVRRSVQSAIWRIQSISLGCQIVHVIALVAMHRVTLLSLGMTALTRSIIYACLHTRLIWRITGKSSQLLSGIGKNILTVLTLPTACALFAVNHMWLAVLVILTGFCVVVGRRSVAILRQWQQTLVTVSN